MESNTLTPEQLAIQKDIAWSYNELKHLLKDNPILKFGGNKRIENVLYMLDKHSKDVPDKDGLKDYEFIYK